MRARRERLLVFASDYEQPFGRFSGSLPHAGHAPRGLGSDGTPRRPVVACASRHKESLDASLLLILPLLLLTAPAVAHAGGFATTGLSSTPDGLRAGQPWKVELTILQHGRTPLSDLRPEIVTIDADGNRTTFRAKPTGRAGRYAATVRFPKAGQWSYIVYDGFNNAMPTTYPAVLIRVRGPGDDRAPARPGRPARAADRARRRAAARRARCLARAPSPAPARPPGLRAVPALLAVARAGGLRRRGRSAAPSPRRRATRA